MPFGPVARSAYAACRCGQVISNVRLHVPRYAFLACFAVIASLVLSACTLNLPPLVTAQAQRYDRGSPSSSFELSAEQVQQLNRWLSERQANWSPSYVSYVPNLLIRSKNTDGSEYVINIAPKLIVVSAERRESPKQFSRSLSDSEHKFLISVLKKE